MFSLLYILEVLNPGKSPAKMDDHHHQHAAPWPSSPPLKKEKEGDEPQHMVVVSKSSKNAYNENCAFFAPH